jgi:hypothetical protein
MFLIFDFHTHIGIDWIEDIWHGDMNKTTKYFFSKEAILFNISTYLGHVFCFPAIFIYQYLYFT